MASVVLGVCSAGAAWGEYASGTGGRQLAVDIAAGVFACLALSRSYRWPIAVALLLAGLIPLSVIVTPAASAAVLIVARERRFAVAVPVTLASVAGYLLHGLLRPIPGLSLFWWLVLVLVGHVALIGWGSLARSRYALISSLRERAERAEAEQGRRVAEARAAERTAIAREMHDVLAHRLSLLATYAGALEYRPDAPPQRLAEAAGVIRTGVHQALDELRDVIALLREDTDAEGDRPLPALADLPDLLAESRAVGTPVQLREAVTDPASLPGNIGRTAYRVLQEALTNARKHAPGQPVSIELDGTPGTQLAIAVRNPLAQAPVAARGSATGLVGLTERVRLVGGQLDHQRAAGEFRLHAWLPWPAG